MRSTGTLLCVGSAAGFGAMAVFGKLAYDNGATVGTLLAVRFALAAALFWVLVIADGSAREIRTLGRRDIALALALGACGYAAQAGCFFAALDRIDASLLSLLLYTFPGMVGRRRNRAWPRAHGLAPARPPSPLPPAASYWSSPARRRARSTRWARCSPSPPR